jgi:hypothetical protein
MGRSRRTAIADLMWLAYGSWVKSRSHSAGGAMATTAWVRGGRPAPVTERVDAPVTRALAQAESYVAQLVVDQRHGPPYFPAEALTESLSVPYVRPTAVDATWASGAMHTLRWLLGHRDGKGPAPAPMHVPVRRPDGSIPTVEERYQDALSAGVINPLPEQRRDLRLQAEVEIARSHRLDARIREIQGELSGRL